MADPTKYTPGYDFSNYQAATPNKPLPGQRLDVELADIAQSIDEAVEAIKDVRRSDGRLQNGSVTAESFSPNLLTELAADVIDALGPEAEAAVQEALPQWRGAWLTGTAYAVNDLARQAGSTYICLVAHTSGTFSTDLAAGRWEMFAQQGAAGAGTGDMLAANNLSDLANVATARSNLGVAAAAATVLKADNLSGLADPAAARTNLGAQAQNALLSALGALAVNGLVARTAAGAVAARAIAGGTGVSVANGDGVSGNPTISVGNLSAAEIAASAKRASGSGGASVTDAQLATAAWVREAVFGYLGVNPATGGGTIFPARSVVNFHGVPTNGTYSRTGTTITVTMAAHGMVTGARVSLDFTTGAATDGTYDITVIDADTFTVTDTASGATSGDVTRNVWIRMGRNISSVIRNGVGDYTITFFTALPSADYAPLITTTGGMLTDMTWTGVIAGTVTGGAALKTTTQLRIQTGNSSTGSLGNTAEVNVAVFV